MTKEGSMWPQTCPPCWVADLAEVPPEARPYYQPAQTTGWILRDILDHIMSVNAPTLLRPVYQIRQFSHRRASFLKRALVPAIDRAFLPLYPERLEDYRQYNDADALHTDLLYGPSGMMYPEFRPLWLHG
jgi:hypothetical protein